MSGSRQGDSKLDDAARAGWLYYVAGNTQDEIAKKMRVSRQSAQRLVSLAVSEKLIKFRLDHSIGRSMELEEALRQRFDLNVCRVVPSDPASQNLVAGLAVAGASEIESHLKQREPQVIALGTGRVLRACVEELPKMDCPQHRLVSLVGNMHSDGSATRFNVVVKMADRVGAEHFPMPLTVLVKSAEELPLLHEQAPIANTRRLCAEADVTFVGIGQIGPDAPLLVDGFVEEEETRILMKNGAIGEIVGWAFDADGRVIDGMSNARVSSAPLIPGNPRPVIGLANGAAKTAAILAALKGRLINGLITDESSAELVLAGAKSVKTDV